MAFVQKRAIVVRLSAKSTTTTTACAVPSLVGVVLSLVGKWQQQWRKASSMTAQKKPAIL